MKQLFFKACMIFISFSQLSGNCIKNHFEPLTNKNIKPQINSIDELQKTFLCKNKNGTEETIFIFYSNNKISKVQYKSSKSVKYTNLNIISTSSNVVSVSFPGDKKNYVLTITDGTLNCLNPDKTVQLFNEIPNQKIPCKHPAGKTHDIKGNVIKLYLDNCETKSYISVPAKGDGANIKEYEFIEYNNKINCYKISVSLYEDHRTFLVHKNSGIEATLNQVTELSGDNAKFVTYLPRGCGYLHFTQDPNLNLVQIENGGFIDLFKYEPESDTCIGEVRWLDNESFEMKIINENKDLLKIIKVGVNNGAWGIIK
ncbi:MAG: hypothetical protein ACK452_10980 [Bacteroidota bacterium]